MTYGDRRGTHKLERRGIAVNHKLLKLAQSLGNVSEARKIMRFVKID